MAVVVFRDIVIRENGHVILGSVTFSVKGFCNLALNATDDGARSIRSLFTISGPQTPPGISISGSVLVDGCSFSIEEFQKLLNQFILFNSRETVHTALSFINPKMSPYLLSHIPEFAGNAIGTLSIEETRIFNLLINIAAGTPLIFLEHTRLSAERSKKYLNLVRNHSVETGTACLIATEYSDIFEGTLVVQDHAVFTVSGDAAAKRHRREVLRRFDFEYQDEEIVRNSYESTVSHNSTSNPWITAGTFRVRNIYAVNPLHVLRLAVRRHATMMSSATEIHNISRNIGLFVLTIICLFIQQGLRVCDSLPYLLEYTHLFLMFPFGAAKFKHIFLVFCLSELLLAREALFSTYLPLNFHPTAWLVTLLNTLKNMFTKQYTFTEFKILTSLLFLFIFSANAHHFEEDNPFFDWYGFRLFSPATYFFSVVAYIYITNVLWFYFTARIFSVPCAGVTLHNCVMVNMLFSSVNSKRLREFLIAFFLSMYLFSPLGGLNKGQSLVFRVVAHLFPPLLSKRLYFEACSSCKIILLLILFNIVVFVVCCNKLVTSRHRSIGC